MSTRLKWSRAGLVLTCETSKRALPRTAWAFSLPPFSSLNTVSPGILVDLLTYPNTSVWNGLHITQAETLPAGYVYTLFWKASGEPNWRQIPLGLIRTLEVSISEINPSTTYRFYLSRTWGGITEDYSEVSILVPAVTPPGTITGLTTYWNAGQMILQWDRSADPRSIEYEVRVGTTWGSAQVLGRTSAAWFEAGPNGTYWVAARFGNTYGTPADVAISGATLLKNVVQTWNEDPDWSGTLSGGAFIDADDGNLKLGGSALCDDLVGTCDSLLGFCDYLGGVAASGAYETPASHVVDIGTVQVCSISSSYAFLAVQPSMTWDSIPGNWDDLVDVWWDGVYNNGLVDIRLYLAVSLDGTTWGDWQPFVSGGTYRGRCFKMKMVLTSSDPNFTPTLFAWSWTVDMPDRIERFTNQSMAASIPGLSITFATPFQVMPNVQVTIHNASAQDTWIRDSINQDANGRWVSVTGHVVNGSGSPVARIVDITAQAY